MKTVRYVATSLLIFTGVLHTIPFFRGAVDGNALPMLVFGVIYLTIGILLMLNLKIARLLGIIFPLIGISTGFFVIGTKNWDVLLSILISIDFVVITCCCALILKREKGLNF